MKWVGVKSEVEGNTLHLYNKSINCFKEFFSFQYVFQWHEYHWESESFITISSFQSELNYNKGLAGCKTHNQCLLAISEQRISDFWIAWLNYLQKNLLFDHLRHVLRRTS